MLILDDITKSIAGGAAASGFPISFKWLDKLSKKKFLAALCFYDTNLKCLQPFGRLRIILLSNRA